MSQKWYQKASVQAAIVLGSATIIANIILLLPRGKNEQTSQEDLQVIEHSSNIIDISSKNKTTNNNNKENGITSEVPNQSLCLKIIEAKNYFDSGNIENKEKSLKIFRSVLSELSVEALSQLNQELLKEANDAYEKSYNDEAARKYQKLFEGYCNQ